MSRYQTVKLLQYFLSSDDENVAASDSETINNKEQTDVTHIRSKLQKKKAKVSLPEDVGQGDEDLSNEEDEEIIAQKRKRDKIKREIMELQREMKGMKNKKAKQSQDVTAESGPKYTEAEEKNDMLISYHQEQKKHASKKLPKKGSSRESQTMAMLEKFKAKLGVYIYLQFQLTGFYSRYILGCSPSFLSWRTMQIT